MRGSQRRRSSPSTSGSTALSARRASRSRLWRHRAGIRSKAGHPTTTAGTRARSARHLAVETPIRWSKILPTRGCRTTLHKSIASGTAAPWARPSRRRRHSTRPGARISGTSLIRATGRIWLSGSRPNSALCWTPRRAQISFPTIRNGAVALLASRRRSGSWSKTIPMTTSCSPRSQRFATHSLRRRRLPTTCSQT